MSYQNDYQWKLVHTCYLENSKDMSIYAEERMRRSVSLIALLYVIETAYE